VRDARVARLAGLLAVLIAAMLLRGWDLGRPDLSFDETFTLDVARRSLTAIPAAVRDLDAHPPLDYLLRHPVAVGDATVVGLRLPSVVLSVAAVAAAALWLRRRGWLGAMAVVLMAIAPFQIEFGREARMYAGMALLGTLAAWLATAWLERPRSRLAVAAGVVVAVALALHVSGLFMAAGLLAVAGARRDRAAWTWRGALAVAGLAWVALWGPAFLEQARRTENGWIPLTTPAGAARALNQLINSYPAAAWVGVAAIVAGGVVIVRSADTPLRRTWVCCFALPAVLLLVTGMRMHVLLPRTLAFASWGPLLALAAIVDWARRRWTVLGVGAAVAVAVLIVPSVVAAPWRGPAEHEAAFDHAAAHARIGDAVAVHPAWLRPLVAWRLGVEPEGPSSSIRLPRTLSGAARVRGERWTGRVWLIEPVTYLADTTGFRSCGPAAVQGAYRVRCLDATSAMDASG
jgi:hypothetical protein